MNETIRVEVSCDGAGRIRARPAEGLTDLAVYPSSMIELDAAWFRSYCALRDSYFAAEQQLRALLDVRWHGAASARRLVTTAGIGRGEGPSRLSYTHPRVRASHG